ncbi:hypothetical protein ACFLQY_02340 [Verrucomicrobiota bacterium]
MSEHEREIDELKAELKKFHAEKEKIRAIMGQVGGKHSAKRDHIVTGVFIVLIAILFILDLGHHIFHWKVPIPPLFSIAVGVLLVSIKIIMMIHKMTKVDHFQFWILNSIEFRVDQVNSRMRKLEKVLKEQAQLD